MLDIANLGIKFESGTVVDATDRFRKFQAEADGAEKSADKVSGAMKKLAGVAGTVAGALASALSVAAIARAADAWSDMQSKVGAAIKSMDDAPRVMRRLVDLANASYSPLEQTARGFATNVGVLRELGYTTNQALDYTEAMSLFKGVPPAVLIEPYFGSNAGDCAAADRHFTALAQGIHEACTAFLKGA